MFRHGFAPLRPWVFCAGVLVAVLAGSSASLRTQEWNRKQIGLVEDWSTQHAIFVRNGSPESIAALQHEPRAFMAWRSAELAQARAKQTLFSEGPVFFDRTFGLRRAPAQIQTDWSVNLTPNSGTGGTADGQFPAKFSFDVTAGPSCANDFAVFPVNQTPNSTHENLVAFNNLYSGSPSGICGSSPTVTWSYAVNQGPVITSPSLSLDGTKVAFVEVTGGQPHFHVLAWKSGQGVISTPMPITSFTSLAPAAGSGTATDLAFGSTGDTLSSPYVDYVNDRAYIGDDKGNLVRISNVFCIYNPLCSTGTPPGPFLDLTWGVGGSVAVGAGSCSGTSTSKLTGPVEDAVTLNVYVGCADGRVYGFNSSGTALSPDSVSVGDGGTHFGGVVDSPVVDGADGLVYAFSGNNGTDAVVVQAETTDLSSFTVMSLGKGGIANVHAGAFNDAYFSSASSSSWLLYAQGYNSTGNETYLYGIGFDSSRNMTGTPLIRNTGIFYPMVSECSPLTEFLNTTESTDWLFYSCFDVGVLGVFNITNNMNAFVNGRTAQANEKGGTSGIIVDNLSSSAQASSIYFSTLGSAACGVGGTGFCAVKLTQSTLQ
jgi:hypothetical protein